MSSFIKVLTDPLSLCFSPSISSPTVEPASTTLQRCCSVPPMPFVWEIFVDSAGFALTGILNYEIKIKYSSMMTRFIPDLDNVWYSAFTRLSLFIILVKIKLSHHSGILWAPKQTQQYWKPNLSSLISLSSLKSSSNTGKSMLGLDLETLSDFFMCQLGASMQIDSVWMMKCAKPRLVMISTSGKRNYSASGRTFLSQLFLLTLRLFGIPLKVSMMLHVSMSLCTNACNPTKGRTLWQCMMIRCSTIYHTLRLWFCQTL